MKTQKFRQAKGTLEVTGKDGERRMIAVRFETDMFKEILASAKKKNWSVARWIRDAAELSLQVEKDCNEE